jgi:hypothetical protein
LLFGTFLIVVTLLSLIMHSKRLQLCSCYSVMDTIFLTSCPLLWTQLVHYEFLLKMLILMTFDSISNDFIDFFKIYINDLYR